MHELVQKFIEKDISGIDIDQVSKSSKKRQKPGLSKPPKPEPELILTARNPVTKQLKESKSTHKKKISKD